MSKLLASAGTITNMLAVVSKYLGGTPVELIAVTPTEWKVDNGTRVLWDVKVIYKAGRFRFEEVDNATQG